MAVTLILTPALALSATITVNSIVDEVADDGICSLREAIVSANSDTSSGTLAGECEAGDNGLDTIAFVMTDCDGVCLIQPLAELPIITDTVIVDGLTQPGSSCLAWPPTLLVEIDGSLAGQDVDGLQIDADESLVRGLVVNQFDLDGIDFDGDDNQLSCSFLGTDATGTEPRGNGRDGIRLNGSNSNIVGGVEGLQRNLISANLDDGVDIRSGAFANQVLDNYIGTDVTGTEELGNSDAGIRIGDRSFQNIVGGDEEFEGNLLSGNGEAGILITGESRENVIQGNYIGTDVAGTFALPNRVDGVQVVDSPNNFIGGPHDVLGCSGACNLISGNTNNGILLVSPDSTQNLIRGNYIGTDRTGTTSIRNTNNGIYLLAGAANNDIGGIGAGDGNIISGNGADGVLLETEQTTGNRLLGNFIGTSANGMQRLSNGNDGVQIGQGSSDNIIGGGFGGGSGNIISGNNVDGVKIRGLSSGNLIQGNCIGVSVDGAVPLGNSDDGVDMGGPGLGDAPNNLVGGLVFSESNLIAFNADDGVELNSGNGNAVLRNAMQGNVGLGIDIADDGISPNDAGDPDTGPNRRQNTPVLVSAAGDASQTLTINYSVATAAVNADYPMRIEFFLADISQQEGAAFLGSDTYLQAEAQQAVAAAIIPLSQVLNGSALVATATDAAGNTSEFSAPVIVGGGAASDVLFIDSFELFITTLACLR